MDGETEGIYYLVVRQRESINNLNPGPYLISDANYAEGVPDKVRKGTNIGEWVGYFAY